MIAPCVVMNVQNPVCNVRARQCEEVILLSVIVSYVRKYVNGAQRSASSMIWTIASAAQHHAADVQMNAVNY